MNPMVIEENKKLRRLQLLVDLTTQILYQSENLSLAEGLRYIQQAKDFAMSLFPDKAETFDLIYKPRLTRILMERGLIDSSPN